MNTWIAATLILFASPVWARHAPPALTGHADDADLTGLPLVQETPPLALTADEVRSSDQPGVRIFRETRGKLELVRNLTITLKDCRAQARLASTRFSIQNGSGTYRIDQAVPCDAVGADLIFKPSTNGGQALGIWQIAQTAEEKLDASIGLAFWSRSVDFIWPASGDYYSFGVVHITRGDAWDVVGHELGHAIYDLGSLGKFGGGPHRIDECYSSELALSEGWASFFSGWLSVDPLDSDAKFEFMVPRRAPIRFENIPPDVCRAPTNEWRVTAFFWDLYDQHSDLEGAEESFARLWAPLFKSGVPSLEAARDRLKTGGVDPDVLERVWQLNFALML